MCISSKGNRLRLKYACPEDRNVSSEVDMYKVRRVTDGWVILYQEGDTTRPVDGAKVYTKRQAAYRRCKKLNDAVKQVDVMIAKDGAIII